MCKKIKPMLLTNICLIDNYTQSSPVKNWSISDEENKTKLGPTSFRSSRRFSNQALESIRHTTAPGQLVLSKGPSSQCIDLHDQTSLGKVTDLKYAEGQMDRFQAILHKTWNHLHLFEMHTYKPEVLSLLQSELTCSQKFKKKLSLRQKYWFILASFYSHKILAFKSIEHNTPL